MCGVRVFQDHLREVDFVSQEESVSCGEKEALKLRRWTCNYQDEIVVSVNQI